MIYDSYGWTILMKEINSGSFGYISGIYVNLKFDERFLGFVNN